MSKKILVIDDEHGIRLLFDRFLKSLDYEPVCLESGKEVDKILSESSFDLVITDLKMPEFNGFDVLKVVKNKEPELPVIILTAFGTIETAVEAVKLGAYDYLTKPVNSNELEIVINKALKEKEILEENKLLKIKLMENSSVDYMIGKSSCMNNVFELIERVAPTDATVLITGESGTGKELIAKAVHTKSLRKDNPLFSINCAAIPETLLESELFGYEKGAFTGAVSKKTGLLLAADKGTLFLDEIGEMPIILQSKILRFLQEGEFIPVGSNKTLKVNVRIITATNKELQKEVEKGTFREDLFYRLNVILIKVPPLRERREDIEDLINFFIRTSSLKINKKIDGITHETLETLKNYAWPGNVRQLQNVIECAVIMSNKNELDIGDLPGDFQLKDKHSVNLDVPLKEARENFEKEYILKLLEKHKWNISKAASEAGLHRTNLHLKMRYYKIDKVEID